MVYLGRSLTHYNGLPEQLALAHTRMHIPSIFDNPNLEEQKALMRAHPLATLVSHTSDGLEAHHIPFHLNTESNALTLQGHIAKANHLHKVTEQGARVLLVFQGPEAYISPNYYPSKARDPRVVPTWNYTAVHVSGTLRFIHDPDWCLAMLNKLTHTHELNFERPWAISDAPSDYIAKMIAAIVGLEITVERIDAKWKVSQNQPRENKMGVVDGLRRSQIEKHDSNQLMADIVVAKASEQNGG